MTNNPFLTQLIQDSADAQSNLYKATFRFSSTGSLGIKDEEVKKIISDESLVVRLTKFNSPARAIQTVALPFQNISLNIPVVSSTLENKLSLSFRVDDNYNLYQLLQKCIPLKSTGEWSSDRYTVDTFKKFQWASIKVDAFSGGNTDYLNKTEGAIYWRFLNCRLLTIPSLGYSYNSPSQLEVSCDFTYEKCEE